MADLTAQILIEIRDEIRATNARLDQTNARLDQTNERLDARIDQTNERLDRLERRQVEAEVRVTTQLVEVASGIRELRDLIVQDRVLRDTLVDHERRLIALERPRA